MTDLPLSGVRVIDLTRILSGPFCSMLLGDLGADVIKIESPATAIRSADRARRSRGFPGISRASTGTRGRSPSTSGAKPDSPFWNGFLRTRTSSPRTTARASSKEWGSAPRVSGELNPRLIVASVNGYGSEGPYADRPAFDFIAQAMSGYMATNGTPETGPMRTAPPLTDLICGLYGALGAVSALHARDRGGAARRVEASMMMSMMSMLAYLSSNALATGRDPVPTGNDHPIASPYGLFRAADGDIAVAPSTEAIVRRFLGELGIADALDDPRFARQRRPAREPRRAERLIDAALGHETQENWIARLNAAGVPCGKIQSLTEALADPQVAAQEMVLTVPHPGRGDVRMTGFPLKFDATPLRVRHPAPELGGQGAEILAEAGYGAEEIAALFADGVAGKS